MPIYEYACNKCGEKTSILHRCMENEVVCDKCGGKMERTVSRLGHFTFNPPLR